MNSHEVKIHLRGGQTVEVDMENAEADILKNDYVAFVTQQPGASQGQFYNSAVQGDTNLLVCRFADITNIEIRGEAAN